MPESQGIGLVVTTGEAGPDGVVVVLVEFGTPRPSEGPACERRVETPRVDAHCLGVDAAQPGTPTLARTIDDDTG